MKIIYNKIDFNKKIFKILAKILADRKSFFCCIHQKNTKSDSVIIVFIYLKKYFLFIIIFIIINVYMYANNIHL